MVQSANTPVVPFVDLWAQHRPLLGEIRLRLEDLVKESAFTGGQSVADFEHQLALFCEAPAAAGCASGTDALMLGLMAAGVTAGQAVITVPNTFIATAEAIVAAGAHPLFVDVDPGTQTLSTEQLASVLERCRTGADGRPVDRVTGREVAAVVPVHLFGNPADMDDIVSLARDYGLKVIEDACQAHGARYKGRRAGMLADAGAFSFYPSKNLGAWGDGGAVVSADTELIARVRLLRDHGQHGKNHHLVSGFCSRLDAVQAVVLGVKLAHVEVWNDERRTHALTYDSLLDEDRVTKPVTSWRAEPVFHLYVIRVEDRDGLRRHLAEAGIETGIHYPVPIHLQPALSYLGHKEGDFPIAERLAGEIVSLPIYPELEQTQVEYVCDQVNAYK